MTDPDRDAESTDRIDRRAVLKGTAVAGLAGSGLVEPASASGWNEIVFTAATDDPFEYQFVVSGRAKRGGSFQSDGGDEVDGDTVRGATAHEASDSFLFTGKLETLRLKGLGKVFVNDDLIEDTTMDDERLPNEITIQAHGDFVEYEFRVSGQVRKGEFANTDDRLLDSNVVRGAVGGGGRDNYRYSGAIAFDKADGPLTVTLELDDP